MPNTSLILCQAGQALAQHNIGIRQASSRNPKKSGSGVAFPISNARGPCSKRHPRTAQPGEEERMAIQNFTMATEHHHKILERLPTTEKCTDSRRWPTPGRPHTNPRHAGGGWIKTTPRLNTKPPPQLQNIVKINPVTTPNSTQSCTFASANHKKSNNENQVNPRTNPAHRG